MRSNVCFWSIWCSGQQGDEFKCLSIYVEVVFYVLHIAAASFLHPVSVLFVAEVFRCRFFYVHFLLGTLFIEINTRTHHHSTNEWIVKPGRHRTSKTIKQTTLPMDIKMKLKFKTEKYFVRLNGRQGVAVRKKQMNVCKWRVEIYFDPRRWREKKTHETNGNKFSTNMPTETDWPKHPSAGCAEWQCKRHGARIRIHNLCINSELNDNKPTMDLVSESLKCAQRYENGLVEQLLFDDRVKKCTHHFGSDFKPCIALFNR